MSKLTLSVLLLLTLCAGAFGQKVSDKQKPKCDLGINQSPELRGFRMGMTQAAVMAKLPGIAIEKPDKFGLARLRLSIIDSTSFMKSTARDKGVQPDTLASDNEGSAYVLDAGRFPALKGVRSVQLRFIDGRLSHLDVRYDDAIKWDSIDQFVETVAATLKLPADWKIPNDSNGSSQEKELRCEGFVLTANVGADSTDIHGGPELVLQDVQAWETMSKRQNDVVEKTKRDEDEKRKSFKP